MGDLLKLECFTRRPERLNEDYVASALQGFETMLLLIGLRRYPNALATLGSALESTLQSAHIDAQEKDGLKDLMKKARKRSPRIAERWPEDVEKTFRDTRNRYVHRGFSPRDDIGATEQLVAVGIPLFIDLMAEFLQFDVYESLLIDMSAHLRLSAEVYAVALERGESAESYCLRGLSARIRWGLRESYELITELITDDDYRRKSALALEFHPAWECNCPICDYAESAVVALDDDALDMQQVAAIRFECVNCGFRTSPTEHLLANGLLRSELAARREFILKDLGLLS